MRVTGSAILVVSIIAMYACTGSRQSLAPGIVEGTAEIGPMCPVEPCDLTGEQRKAYFEQFRVLVTDTRDRFAETFPIDSLGRFRFELQPGTYRISVKPLEAPSDDPQLVELKSNSTQKLKLYFDTGLR